MKPKADKPTTIHATLSISLPADMAERVRARAEGEGETVSRVIRTELEPMFGRGRGRK